MFCQKCSTQNPDDASFCSECGSNLNKIEKVKKEVIFNQQPSKKGGWGGTILIIIIGLI